MVSKRSLVPELEVLSGESGEESSSSSSESGPEAGRPEPLVLGEDGEDSPVCEAGCAHCCAVQGAAADGIVGGWLSGHKMHGDVFF